MTTLLPALRRFLAVLALCLLASAARATTCHVVGPTATGLANGQDFNNVMLMPASNGWQRGHIYYFLPGSYSSKLVMGTPVSSTTTILAKRATLADHGAGCTPSVAAGYNDATMGQTAGPAQTRLMEMLTSYNQVDGAFHPDNWYTNGGGLNVQSQYGFYVNMNVGCAPGTCWALNVDNSLGLSNISMSNIGIYGRGDAAADTSPDFMIRFVQSGGNHTFSYIGMYNSSNSFIQARNTDNVTIDHVWGEHNRATAANHAEPITVAATNHWTVRYSVFKDIEGTGGIVNLSDGTHGLTSDDWNIYGNLFFVQPGNPTGRNGMGNGILSCINDQLSTNWRFVNNTIAYMPGFTRVYFLTGSGNCAGQTGLLVKDNIWFSNAFPGSANHGVATLAGFDYNSYLQTTTNDPGANTIIQAAGASPFVAATPAVGSDFFLKTNGSVTPWLNLNGTIAGNATDGVGVTRALSRGTFELATSTASLSITPSPLAFGNQNITTTGSLTATVTNVGTASATLSNPSYFTITPSVFTNGNTGTSGQCASGTTLAPTQSCTVLVRFTPTAVTTYSGTLNILGSVSASVPLSGAGTNAISIPSVPTGLTPSVSGSTVNLSWTASTGTVVNYNVARATVSGGPYTVIASPTGTTYADTSRPNGTYYYVVRSSNSAGTSAYSTQVSATVATAAAANLAPSSLSFGSVPQGGTSSAQVITVNSVGTAPLVLASSNAVTVASPDFTISATTCTNSLSIAVGSSCTITVTFNPSTTGTISSAVVILSNDPGSPDSISLSGTGTTAIDVAPTSINFGRVNPKKTSTAHVVTYTNNSGSTVTFSSINVSGGDSSQFVIDNTVVGRCQSTVANGSSCTITLTFQPASAGNKSSSLVITDSSSGSPYTVPLTGQGTGKKVLQVGAVVGFRYIPRWDPVVQI